MNKTKSKSSNWNCELLSTVVRVQVQFSTKYHLEKRSPLPFLISTDFKVFAPLDWVLGYMFAALALQPQHNLFCSFSLLVENRLSLPTIPWLFPIVTALALHSQTIFPLFVLSYLMQGVLSAFLRLAVCLLCLWNIHLYKHTTPGQSTMSVI